MKPALGQEVGQAICEKVGLDPKAVAQIVVTIKPDEIVYVDITMFDDEGEVSDVILSYGLRPLGPTDGP